MRIIAGQWRGRRIASPPSENTRPFLDRAKTILFDILGSRLAEPGKMPPIAVLDLFAGTGTLGLEALSRGARYCRFVERHRATAALLRRTLDELKIIREAEVTETDVRLYTISPPPAFEDQCSLYELVFIDPPYHMLRGQKPDPAITQLLRQIAESESIADSATIVVRHEMGHPVSPDLSPLVDESVRHVGAMTLRFLKRPTASTANCSGGVV